jgi:hypothetical protein
MPLFYYPCQLQPTPPQTANGTKPFLTEAQVAAKCRNVPVFVLMDAAGAPLTVTLPGKKPMIGAFLRQEEAQEFYKKLPQTNKTLLEQVRISQRSLAEIVQQAARDPKALYALVASNAAVKEAQEVLSKQGKKPGDLKGVPIFLIRQASVPGSRESDTNIVSYVTLRVGSDASDVQVPCFFTKKDADALMQKFLAQDPTVKLSLEVGTLEGIIHLLQTSPNPEIQQITFFPSIRVK